MTTDYEKALSALRTAIDAMGEFCKLMEPHRNEHFYYIDGWCGVSFDNEFNFSDMRETICNLQDSEQILDDYVNDEVPGLDLSYMFEL